MTVKLVVLYTHPDDVTTFEQHYRDVHAPLVRQVPGLERFEAGVLAGAADGGDHTYHRLAELYFADRSALEAGLASEQGAAAAADFQNIAPAGSRMFVAAVD